MSQLLYLSRHGTVKINQEEVSQDDPKAYDLLEKGIEECRDLGAYLNRQRITNPFFVDSGVRRTVVSVGVVAETMGIALVSGKNYYSAAALGEEVPWEALTQEQKEKYYCGHHRKRPIKTALELGVEVQQELVRIGKAFPENNLVAILHGGINLGLITYLTGHLKPMENCGLYVLERIEDRLKVRGDYISPARMREAVRKARIATVL